jgi:integrase
MDLAAKESRERLTFKQATDEFLNLHANGWRNSKHRAQWKSTLTEHAFPKLGDRAVATIDAAMINEAVQVIWMKTPETARRVRGRIDRIVQWVKDGKPLPGAGKNGKRKHPALPWQELPQFMAELRQRQGVSARALEFAILTTARTGETIGATWDEIDLDAKIWMIPGERMKAGRAHRVPLSAAVLALREGVFPEPRMGRRAAP